MARSKNFRHTPAFLTLVLLLLASLAGCSKNEPIKIGFVDGLRGSAADLGQASRDGALIAVEHHNASGGINGRKIELIIKDDEHRADVAERVVRELVAEGVVAIVGHGTSNTTVAGAPIANAANTVMISHTATTKELSGKYGYFFRVINATDKYSTKSALFHRHTLKEKRVAIVYDGQNRSYTESWMEDFVKTFTAEGGLITTRLAFNSSASPGMHQLAQQLCDSKPDGIVIIANSRDTANLSVHIRKLNGSVNLATSEWAATESLIEMGGKSMEGIYSTQFIDRNSMKPEYLAFREEYIRRFGREPGFGGVMAYDAIHVLIHAIEKNSDRENLNRTIMSIDKFPSLQGAIRFNPAQEADRPAYITTILNGQFRTYEN